MILQQKAPFDSPLIYLYVCPCVRTTVRSHGRAPKALPYHLRLSAAVLFLGRPPSLSVLSQRGSADRTAWTRERDLQQMNEGREV